ncbi:MAG TPA: hypothetical protein PLS51_04490 [Flavobacterium sp.]|jgi:hypothetical protein|nr:hypothetical protein [Flavobacterium sp.]HPJ09864.1 hypothetical protein [Flavobacterium sp.]
MKKDCMPRWIAIVLLLLTGLNAIVAGTLFIVSPDGSLMGMSVSTLRFAPFGDFLVPGIVLFTVNGCFNIIVALLVFFRTRYHAFLVSFQGLVLVGWIIVQVCMLRVINGLHLTLFTVGVMLFLAGMFLHREKS